PGALLGEVLKAVAEALPAKRAAVSMKEVENVASERLGRPRQKGDRSTKERLLGNEWFGTGSFHALLYKLRIDGWELTSTGSFVPADPIPTPSTSPVPVRTRQGPIRAVTETHPELAGCVQKVKSANTNIPLLPPDAYAVLFQALAPRVRNDLPSGQLPPNTDGLLRAVEKDCADTPYPVDQAAVSYVLNSVTRFVRDCPEEEVQLRRSCSGSWEVAIAEYFAARVVRVCQTGGQALSSEEQDHLRLWLLGGFKRTAVVTDGVA
ncbi:MAG TPA: hypothetical protein VD866_03255, partial [Urbifossiella sp.]|nr:hypothetical protein [Urbifossiella sp.]